MSMKSFSSCTSTEKYESKLYTKVKIDQKPIIYDDIYNISFCGLEKLHPFDSGKWGKIVTILIDKGFMQRKHVIKPEEAAEEDLLFVHTKRYINSLKYSFNVAMITEIPPVSLVPNFIVQRVLLKRLRYQTGGTVLAAKVATERGWSINIGGGFHHCSSDSGGGFCAYADITLAIKLLLENDESIKKVMIIDLDAHQGNGHERDFMTDDNVYIMDVYNCNIYPMDTFAKDAINKKVELRSFTEDKDYLDLVSRNMNEALDEFQPDFVLYNAGTDILEGDPLGALSVTGEGIIQRDEIVFEALRRRDIPITMVTSGGYQRRTAAVIAESILNLEKKALLSDRTS